MYPQPDDSMVAHTFLKLPALGGDVEQTRRRWQAFAVIHAHARVREDRRRILPRVTQRLHRATHRDRDGVLCCGSRVHANPPVANEQFAFSAVESSLDEAAEFELCQKDTTQYCAYVPTLPVASVAVDDTSKP